MIAYDYPLLGLFWTALIVFIWIAWLMLLFRVIFDIFRSDIKGISKAIWALAVVIVPFLGVLMYLIIHGDDMTGREVSRMQDQETAMRQYIQSAAGGGGVADELAKLSELRTSGVISDAEFEAQKAKLLA